MRPRGQGELTFLSIGKYGLLLSELHRRKNIRVVKWGRRPTPGGHPCRNSQRLVTGRSPILKLMRTRRVASPPHESYHPPVLRLRLLPAVRGVARLFVERRAPGRRRRGQRRRRTRRFRRRRECGGGWREWRKRQRRARRQRRSGFERDGRERRHGRIGRQQRRDGERGRRRCRELGRGRFGRSDEWRGQRSRGNRGNRGRERCCGHDGGRVRCGWLRRGRCRKCGSSWLFRRHGRQRRRARPHHDLDRG